VLRSQCGPSGSPVAILVVFITASSGRLRSMRRRHQIQAAALVAVIVGRGVHRGSYTVLSGDLFRALND
jgi:hypothetical protein